MGSLCVYQLQCIRWRFALLLLYLGDSVEKVLLINLSLHMRCSAILFCLLQNQAHRDHGRSVVNVKPEWSVICCTKLKLKTVPMETHLQYLM